MSTTETMEREQERRMRDAVDRLLTVEQAAEVMGISLGSVRAMVLRGELPICRPTGRRLVRIPLRALLRFLQQRTQEPGAAK